MRVDVLTLFPEMVRAPLSHSILGRAFERGVLELGVHDIRAHTDDRHRSVDATPYGGGAGMVLKVDVVARAIEAVRRPDSHVVLTSAAGERLEHAGVLRLSAKPHLVVVCGHYEGIDARVETLVDQLVSIGDFVVTGGEVAAIVLVDAVARLVPGVLGNAASAAEESFVSGLLEHPQYTRPRTWRGHEVPEVLLSGHHRRIAAWRRERAEERTRQRRPDLWARYLQEGAVPVAGPRRVDDDPGVK